MLSFVACAVLQSGQFAIHDHDRILFYGDSITDNQYYPQFVEQFILTRFPKMKVTFMNYGWSGDRVTGGGGGDIRKRLSRDVYPNKPTVVTIMLGMNDASYRPWDENIFHTYADGYENIARNIKSNTGARLTFILPSPYDDVTVAPGWEGGYNGVLIRYGDFLKEIAPNYQAVVADFNQPMVDMLKRANGINTQAARQIIPDRVHPSAAGHIVMGAALLKAWNAPSIVSSTSIDATTSKGSIENGQIRDVKKTKTGWTWRSLENALPLYFWRANDQVALVLKSSDVEKDLNNETVTVKGLPAGKFALSIDGERVGSFTGDQLRSGINLAQLDTPMMRQSMSIFTLTDRRQNLQWTMWRKLVVDLDGYGLDKRQGAIDAMKRLENEIVQKQRQMAQPKWHTFALDPA